jgi:hypothetical protein
MVSVGSAYITKFNFLSIGIASEGNSSDFFRIPDRFEDSTELRFPIKKNPTLYVNPPLCTSKSMSYNENYVMKYSII